MGWETLVGYSTQPIHLYFISSFLVLQQSKNHQIDYGTATTPELLTGVMTSSPFTAVAKAKASQVTSG